MSTMTARTAQRLAGGAFAACVLVGLGIGAMLLLGLPGLPRPAPVMPAGGPAGAGETPAEVDIVAPERREWAAPAGDGRAIAARLALIENAPRPPEPETPDPADNDTGPDDTGPEQLGEEVRYLGMIRSGESRRAVLRIGDRQRIVAEGDRVTIDGQSVTVRRVRAEGVELAGENAREPVEVRKADRERASVTVVDGEAPSGTISGAATTEPKAPEVDLPDTPEIRRILQDHERRVNAIKERIERGLLTEESGERLLESIEQQRQANIERALRRTTDRGGE